MLSSSLSAALWPCLEYAVVLSCGDIATRQHYNQGLSRSLDAGPLRWSKLAATPAATTTSITGPSIFIKFK
uniref:Putative secreted protein n=1 Tax=Anopheles marajoara TaxID=58244 RepID=A0A2M4CE23_9DIPT